MINWRNGRAALVGASKYLIKGFFSYAHSITSAAPAPPTEDCFLAFEGPITDSEGFIGFINDDPVAVIGLINDDPVATIGTIHPTKGFEGPLTDREGFEGEITDSEGFEGDICDC